MYGLSIALTDNATPFCRRVAVGIHASRIAPVVGRAGVNALRDFLFDLDGERANELGGKRQHFYAAAARSTQFQVEDSAAILSINHVGFAQRFFGGRIEPVNTRYLTIPARTEAYGKRAGEFDNLEVLYGRNGPWALAERESIDVSFRKGKKGTKAKAGQERGGLVLYFLVTSVDQEGDETVLPTSEELLGAVMPHVDSYIDRLVA